MKLKMPMMSVEARGTVGGLTYNTWKGINYVKCCTSPTGQGTAKRLAAQGVLITISKLWSTIGDTARAAWNQYAADHPVTSWTGPPMHLTGMNWYMKCNIQLFLQGNALRINPPTDAAPDPAVGLALSQDIADLFVTWTTPDSAALNIIFFLVGPKSAGITGKIEMAKYQIAYGANAAVPVVLKANAPAGTYTVFAKVMSPVTGLCSSWTSHHFAIT